MYLENINRLDKALRGQLPTIYIQGNEYLKKYDEGEIKHCCLGVAEDLIGCEWEKKYEDGGFEIFFANHEEDGRQDRNQAELTQTGRAMYGFRDASGSFFEPCDDDEYIFENSLVEMNDNGSTFEEIANKIQWGLNNPKSKMFTEAVYREVALEKAKS